MYKHTPTQTLESQPDNEPHTWPEMDASLTKHPLHAKQIQHISAKKIQYGGRVGFLPQQKVFLPGQ